MATRKEKKKMIYLGYYSSSHMLQDDCVPVSIDRRIPESDVPEVFRPLFPGEPLQQWFLSMAEVDKEVKETFYNEYVKEISDFNLPMFLDGLEEKYAGKKVVLLGYDEDEKYSQIDVLKKYLKSLKVKFQIYDANIERYGLSLKEGRMFRDFFVKLRRIYAKDVYVFGDRYICAGELSNLELSGTMVCEVEPIYQEVIGKVFQKKHVYIPDIDVIKQDYSAFVEASDQETKLAKQDILIYDEDDEQSVKFTECIELKDPEQIQKIFFDDKIIIDVKDPKKKVPNVLIGSPLLPMVTLDNLNQLNCIMDVFEENESDVIYQIKFSFWTEYFQYKVRYLYI